MASSGRLSEEVDRWDETNIAVPAIQILGGTFPVHYWTGTELLRRSEWAVTFPPATVRGIRIRPAVAASTWSIAEIVAFE
jgi:hypothetical protein